MDIEYLLMLQDLRNGDWAFLEPIFIQVTNFITSPAYYLIMAVTYWCLCKSLGQRLCIAFTFGSLANQLLKLTFCVYRPWIRDIRVVPTAGVIGGATSYSFPSGHVHRATAMFGNFAVTAWKKNKRLLALLSLLVIVAVAFSRNFLGVHTPQDVVVSFFVTMLMVVLADRFLRWWDANPKKNTLVGVAGMALLIVSFVYINVKTYPMDYAADGTLLVDPVKMMNDSYVSFGLLLGAIIGSIVERKYIQFSTDISSKQKLLRAIPGGIILLGFILFVSPWLRQIFSIPVAYFISFSVIMFFTLAGYPAIFSWVEAKLAGMYA